MTFCNGCNQDMRGTDSCASDGQAIETYGDKRCHDCDVAPGGTHHWGCDVERCSVCRGQMLSCGCSSDDHDPNKAKWRGQWPGTRECEVRGWYSRFMNRSTGKLVDYSQPFEDWHGQCYWEQCSADAEGASADLNRWAEAGCPSP